MKDLNHNERMEVEKVKKKVPKWMQKNYTQINSVILLEFLALQREQSHVTKDQLRTACSQWIAEEKFDGNFNQMLHFGPKNHGKVFTVHCGQIQLWKPVADFIRSQHKIFIGSDEMPLP